MKFLKRYSIGLFAASMMLFTSCNKSEGEGGKSTISGYVYKITDDGGIKVVADGLYEFARDTVVAMGEDVFIVYGADDDIYDDKTKTSYAGQYKFEYLREGNYKLYVYSDSDEGYSATEVHCGKSGTTQADNIYIYDGKNSGKSGIVGKVKVWYASKGVEYINGVGQRVYIREEGTLIVNDTRTDSEGVYTFSRLKPNTKYTVWAEHETVKNGDVVAVKDTLTTGASGEIVSAKDLEIKAY